MSFVRAILERLDDRPERVAIACGFGTERQQWSAGSLRAAVERARVGLRACGLRPGDRIVLVGKNSPAWLAVDLAILAEGCAVVAFDPRAAEGDDLEQLVADCDPRAIVHDAGLDVRGAPSVARFELEALTQGSTPVERDPCDVPPDTLACLIYTSGSSGRPKGAMLTRNNVGFMLRRTEARLAELTGLPFGAERALHYLPLCYAGSHVLALSCLLRGARLELVSDPTQLGDALGLAQADYFLNVPLVLERFQRAATAAVEGKGPVPSRLLSEARAAWARRELGEGGLRDRILLAAADRAVFAPIRARFGSRLRGVICGSAPLSPETQGFFHMIGVPVYQGYGLTETSALCTLDTMGNIQPGRVGPALSDVEMRCSPDGEIETRGPHVFVGYWGRPGATREAFTEDGWFRTGDLGDVDAEGRWRIGGRQSAMLVLASGHNVPPEPLEEALRVALLDALGSRAQDAQVIVVGHGRPHASALIASTELRESEVAGVLAELNAGLEPKRRLHRFALVSEAFSSENGLLTTNLKPRRRAIAERHAEAIDALYAREGAPAS